MEESVKRVYKQTLSSATNEYKNVDDKVIKELTDTAIEYVHTYAMLRGRNFVSKNKLKAKELKRRLMDDCFHYVYDANIHLAPKGMFSLLAWMAFRSMIWYIVKKLVEAYFSEQFDIN